MKARTRWIGIAAALVLLAVIVLGMRSMTQSGDGWKLRGGTLTISRNEASDVLMTQFYQIEEGSIRKLEILEGVTELKAQSFMGCKNLREVHLPEGLQTIGFGAFYGCEDLQELVLPQSLNELGDEALAECRSLERLVFLGERPVQMGQDVLRGCSGLKTLVLPPQAKEHWEEWKQVLPDSLWEQVEFNSVIS